MNANMNSDKGLPCLVPLKLFSIKAISEITEIFIIGIEQISLYPSTFSFHTIKLNTDHLISESRMQFEYLSISLEKLFNSFYSKTYILKVTFQGFNSGTNSLIRKKERQIFKCIPMHNQIQAFG